MRADLQIWMDVLDQNSEKYLPIKLIEIKRQDTSKIKITGNMGDRFELSKKI